MVLANISPLNYAPFLYRIKLILEKIFSINTVFKLKNTKGF